MLVSVIVHRHLQALPTACNAAPEADAKPTAPDESFVARAAVQHIVEEQIRPLREQVRRLEAELHALPVAGNEA
jgi:hypothetical protein